MKAGTTLLAAALAAWMLPAWALYKVVGPDGRVTYTDRPPADARAARVPGVEPPAVAPAAERARWPAALREAAERFPVTLYAAASCTPCDEARRLLQARGVPFSEKRIASEEEVQALERLSGARLVPALTIGRQAISGLQPQDWNGWLDAAGYPRSSVLPASWKPPAPTALIPGRPASAPSATTAAAAAPGANLAAPPATPLPEPRPGPGGIRF